MQVDVTEITKDIDEAIGDLRRRYLECEDVMGGCESPVLLEFLTLYGRGGSKRVKVHVVDCEGQPVTHVDVLYEMKLDGHVYGNNYAECVNKLNFHLSDLRKLAPTKLFCASKWPKQLQLRGRKTVAEHHADVASYSHDAAVHSSMRAWILTLERDQVLGERRAGQRAPGGAETLAKWREKPRRPAKSPAFAAAERKRKGKALMDDQEREKVVHGFDWYQKESDEDDEEAYAYEDPTTDGATDDNPFHSDDEGEDVEEIDMVQPQF
ncbi:unnamed protein product [Closterium sp. Naga37s-1]|nr:unnamed protein product [Closterium sp. Naga37s-1]